MWEGKRSVQESGPISSWKAGTTIDRLGKTVERAWFLRKAQRSVLGMSSWKCLLGHGE